MQERYRANYDGEFVVVDTVWKNGRKLQSREWIANPIINQHISGRAVVVGTGDSIHVPMLTNLNNHRGGLLGQKKLQTYGTPESWRALHLDFCYEINDDHLKRLIETKYTQTTVVYTTTKNCLKYPGNFFMVPYAPRLCPEAMAAYLAAFDGHQEIFFIGVDAEINGAVDVTTIAHIEDVIKTYPNVKFRFITDGKNPPDQWRVLPNVDVWNYKQFISYCDI